MLATEKYRISEASIEKAAKITGVSISKMINIFKGNGDKANRENEVYLKGLKALRKVW